MLNYLIKYFLNSKISHNKHNVEELLYDKKVYPQYLITRSNFNYAMKNRLLDRQDILNVKIMLNQALFKRRHYNTYKGKKYSNDAHEIYSKLKCKYLSRKQLITIDKFISNIITNKQRTIGSSTLTQITQS